MARQTGSLRAQRYGSVSKTGKKGKKGYAHGGKAKYATGGKVRGGGAARRGLKFTRSA
jgi:hypothetical protein